MIRIKRFCILMCAAAMFISFPCRAEWDDSKERKAAKFGSVAVENTKNVVYGAFNFSHGKKVNLSAYGADGSLKYFHGMFYLAKMTKKYTAKACDSKGGTVRIKKGETILVTCFSGKKKKAVCRLKNKRAVYVPAKYFKVNRFLYNPTSAYTDAQVEEWVASKKINSKTKYMFVVSKYNQHGWILTKKNGKWICKYVLELTTSSRRDSTGRYPNDYYGIKTCAIYTHYIHKKGMGRGISYHSQTGGNQIHYRGNVLYPSTHGCVAMRHRDYNFIYWYLPYKTRVVLF